MERIVIQRKLMRSVKEFVLSWLVLLLLRLEITGGPDIPFHPEDLKLVDRMVKASRMIHGKYVSVHLRYEEDMVAFSCCIYDGREKEKLEMDAAREIGWSDKFYWKGQIIRPGIYRRDGKCPMTPLEVGVQTSQMKMVPTGGLIWESYNENIASYEDGSITAMGLLEQLNITRDNTDYLWYTTSVDVGADEPFMMNGALPVLAVQSAGHALHVFVNGQYTGSQFGSKSHPKVRYSSPIKLNVGTNKISLLSMTVGLQNIGPHFEASNAGVLGPVTLSGFKDGSHDLSLQRWSYQVGLKGEAMNIDKDSENSEFNWMKGVAVPQKQPLTWYKATFDAPAGQDPVGLDLGSMGKGQAWVNGESIGRYWPSYIAEGPCSNVCSYQGTFRQQKCSTNCGQPSQRWYHVPRSWLRPTGNSLILFEEIGGNPSGISVATRSVDSVCAHVSESHSKTINSWRLESTGSETVQRLHKPKVHLQCAEGQQISAIKFASFGTPQGVCGSFQQGNCHSSNSLEIVQKRCVGLQRCSLSISGQLFGGDPCPGILKHAAIEVVCS